MQTFAKDRLPKAVPQPTLKPLPKAINPKPAIAAATKRMHVIQSGENLWKIARKYKVSVEAIRKANHLETDKLRVGKQLIIPVRED